MCRLSITHQLPLSYLRPSLSPPHSLYVGVGVRTNGGWTSLMGVGGVGQWLGSLPTMVVEPWDV
jgi:hypothetical protein